MIPKLYHKSTFFLIFIMCLLLNVQVHAESYNGMSTKQIQVFVSSSMPTESLKQWFIQAQNIHAPVILRGLVQNSLPATQQWLAMIVGTNAAHYGVQINPVAFERYGIQQVPAVVVSSKTTTCPVNMSCPAPSFEVVYGNIGLPKALDIIANLGEKAP